MNPDLLAVRPHASRTISDAIRDMPSVIDLTVGVPDFGPPAAVRRALAAATAAPSTVDRYEHAQGSGALRAAIVERYRARHGLDYTVDQVLVTHGASEALWLAVFAFTAVGDRVLLPDPGYMLYSAIVEALGRRPVRVQPSATDMAGALLFLNSPSNPTGAVLDRATLAGIVDAALRAGAVVVHDEVFDDFSWTRDHVPAAAVAPPGSKVVMVNSMSKRWGMTGWRLGWMAGPAPLVALATKAHTFALLASSSPVQAAVAPVLNDEAVAAEVARHSARMRARLDRLAAALAAVPGFDLADQQPGGGFYLFPRVESIGTPDQAHATTGEAAAEALLRRCGVAVVPGIAFGPAGRDHVRISIAGPDAQLDDALARLALLRSG